MSVYVDPLRPSCTSGRWRWSQSCHLTADTLEELTAFAGQLGLPAGWLEVAGRTPHFDLTRRWRALAVGMGAVEITLRQAGERIRAERRTADAH